MVQTVLSDKRPVFQDENVPIHTCGIARVWFDERNNELDVSSSVFWSQYNWIFVG